MNTSVATDKRWFLALVVAVGIVPIVYFHNGLVTEYYFSKTVWANILIPLPVLALLWQALRRRVLELPPDRILLPVLMFSAWALVSLAWATNPFKGLELLGKVGAGPFALMATIFFVRSVAQIRGMLLVVLLSMTVVSVYGFVQYFEVTYLPKDQYGDADPSTTIGLTNFVVEYMMPFLLVGPMMFLNEQRRWVRALLLFATGAVYVYVIISRNRAGMLGWLGEVGALSILLAWLTWRGGVLRFRVSPRAALTITLAFVMALSAVLGGTVVGRRVVERFVDLLRPAAVEAQVEDMSILDTFLARARRDASVRFRLETWYQCLKNMFPAAPWIGVGFANLEVEFPRHYTTFLEGMTLRNNTRVVRSHNEYVQALVDLGLVGFILFAWILLQIWRTAAEGLRYCRELKELWLWIALNLGFVGFAIEMFFAFPLQVPTSSILFFVAVGLSSAYTRILRERDERVEPLTLALTTPARRVVYALLVAALTLGVLRMEAFAYSAMVGEVRNKEARVYKRYQRWEDSYRLLTDAIEHYPYMEGYYYDRAVVQMQMNRLDAALKDLLRTAELVPNYAMGRKQIGMLAAQLGKTELAIAEFTKTGEIYKTQRDEIAELIAHTALKGRRPELAIAHLEPLIATGQAPAKLDRYLADAYVQVGRWQDALPVFERLRMAGEWDEAVRLQYASTLYMMSRLDEAEQIVERLLLDASDRAEAHMLAGKIALKRGQQRDARRAFERALALKPSLLSAFNADPEIRDNKELAEWLRAQ